MTPETTAMLERLDVATDAELLALARAQEKIYGRDWHIAKAMAWEATLEAGLACESHALLERVYDVLISRRDRLFPQWHDYPAHRASHLHAYAGYALGWALRATLVKDCLDPGVHEMLCGPWNAVLNAEGAK